MTTSVITPNCSAFASDTGPAAEATVASVITATPKANRRGVAQTASPYMQQIQATPQKTSDGGPHTAERSAATKPAISPTLAG